MKFDDLERIVSSAMSIQQENRVKARDQLLNVVQESMWIAAAVALLRRGQTCGDAATEVPRI